MAGHSFCRGFKVGFAKVRGLEWETPDRFREEIEAEEYRRWLLSLETRDEWKRRVRVADEIISEALKTARKLIE